MFLGIVPYLKFWIKTCYGNLPCFSGAAGTVSMENLGVLFPLDFPCRSSYALIFVIKLLKTGKFNEFEILDYFWEITFSKTTNLKLLVQLL